jgi:hypothetical protein
MVGGGQRRLNFSDWFNSELGPMLRTELAEDASVTTRVIQARAVLVVQAYSTSLKVEEFRIVLSKLYRVDEGADCTGNDSK